MCIRDRVKGVPKQQKWREHNPEPIERILPMIRPLMLEMGYGDV